MQSLNSRPDAAALRILYLHQHYSSPAGATATRSHAMASALAARGHAVTLVCGRYEGAHSGLSEPFRGGRRVGRAGAPGGGFRVIELDIPCSNMQGTAARALAFLRFAARAAIVALRGPGEVASSGPPNVVRGRGPWDVVLASSTPLTVVLPALAVRGLRGVPFVFEVRDPWPELPRAMGAASPVSLAVMERLANAACREAAAVVALTEGMAETAMARGADPARVHVVPNGCDLDLFGPHVTRWRPPSAAAWECLAVYAGAHGRANGLDALLAAAAILQARGEHRVRLLLVGEGSEKPRLQVEVRDRKLYNTSFLDPMPKHRLASLLAGSQIALHCLAPIAEFAEWTAPNKLMDGLAAGLPVVTNATGRTARIVSDIVDGCPCGIAVTPSDPAALADALTALAADPARRAAMGRSARRQAVQRWDRRRQARLLCEVVEAVTSSLRVANMASS